MKVIEWIAVLACGSAMLGPWPSQAVGAAPLDRPGSPGSASRIGGGGIGAAGEVEPDVGPRVPLKYPFPPLRPHAKDHVEVNFAHLACFDFEAPTDPVLQRSGERKRIPWEVLALDGRLVRIEGYMMPVDQDEEGRTRECLIVRNTLVCCYGRSPAPNEWVLVKVREPGAVVIENVPLFFYGRLHVGEIYENGVFAGLYRLDCDRVTLGE
jgi:hypothetical protein